MLDQNYGLHVFNLKISRQGNYPLELTKECKLRLAPSKQFLSLVELGCGTFRGYFNILYLVCLLSVNTPYPLQPLSTP